MGARLGDSCVAVANGGPRRQEVIPLLVDWSASARTLSVNGSGVMQCELPLCRSLRTSAIARPTRPTSPALATIDMRIAEIDQRLKAEFPDYAALSRPEPVSVEDVQAELRPDEALVLFLDTPECEADARGDLYLGRDQDRHALGAIRSGHRRADPRGARRCAAASTAAAWDERAAAPSCWSSYARQGPRYRQEPLPFDLARAHELYKALFGEVEDLIKGKHLLLVPSGPLTQLPFQVLVTEPPAANGDHRSAAWLVREHAITVLPAVSSLKALRRVAKPSAATKPMIGFGNPLLDGDQMHVDVGDYCKQQAQLARDKQRCAETRGGSVAPCALRARRSRLCHAWRARRSG